MTDPWAPIAERFAHRHRVPRGADARVPLRELKPVLRGAVTTAIDGVELWGADAALLDLHGVRAAAARRQLGAMFDAPLWIVSTGKGEGVMRAVLREVVEASHTHTIVRWAGETMHRPAPSLAIVARHDLAEAVRGVADGWAASGYSWRSWLVAAAFAAAILYEFCVAG